MNYRSNFALIIYCLLSLSLLACDQAVSIQNGKAIAMGSFSTQPEHNFQLSLTAKDHPHLSQGQVEIDHFELFSGQCDNYARLKLGESIGSIDVLALNREHPTVIESLDLPEELTVNKVRLVFAKDGHQVTNINAKECQLKSCTDRLPSVSVRLDEPFTIEPGFQYSVIADVFLKEDYDSLKRICRFIPLLNYVKVVSRPIDDGGTGGEGPPEPMDGGNEGGEGPGELLALTFGANQLTYDNSGGLPIFDSSEDLYDYTTFKSLSPR